MSTRSVISYRDNYGYHAVYCHFDGYPEYTGNVLYYNYNTIEKINRLVCKGDLSVIDANIDDCEFYLDKPDEDFNACKTKEFTSVEDLFKYAKDMGVDYIYVFMEDKPNKYDWYIGRPSSIDLVKFSTIILNDNGK